MKRRVLAVAAAIATGAIVLPATPAAASANAVANLTSAAAVYPGSHTMTVSVTNNEAAGVLGVGAGKTINAIRVTFPVDQAGIRLGSGAGSAGAGFTVAEPTNLGSTQYITYRRGSGSGLAPGQSATITFPTTVTAPSAKDLSGAFRVHVSSDNFGTSSGALGNLGVKVQVLEILQSGLKPIAPEGATDRSGTGAGYGFAGQTVDYAVAVKNHAASALPVSVGIASTGADTATGQSITVPGGGGEATATVPVKLGEALADRAAVLTATAAATGASAPAKTDTFQVQAPVRVPLSNLQPRRWRTGADSARDFTVSAAKTGTPSVTALTGAMTFAGGNTCPVKGAPTFGSGNANSSLTFACPDLNGTADYAEVVPTGAGTLTDGNGASYGFSSLLDTLILDNLAPVLDAVVTLPTDVDGDQQIAVKPSGDRITVGGNIGNAGDLATNTVLVTLKPDVGDPITFTAPISGSGETRTYSGSATPTWPATANSFTAMVSATDTSENLGEADALGTFFIDRVAPKLADPGTIVNESTIEVSFQDANQVAGGCHADFWLIDGRPGRVSSVTTSDASSCSALGNGVRLLTLSSPLGPDDTPTVTYDPAGARQTAGLFGNKRPAKDGAGVDSLRWVIDTVTELIPGAPGIVSLERLDSASTTGAYEAATFDTEEQRYFTNVNGDDALRLTVNNIRSGYEVRVTRDGQTVASTNPATPTQSQLNGSSFSASIVVPMPDTQSAHTFAVQLVSTQGKESDPTQFTVVLDKLLPTFGNVSWNPADLKATVLFAEKIVAGSDFADNWLACEAVQRESGAGEVCVPPDSVTGADQRSRTITVTTFENPTNFRRVDYFVQSGNRYEDRAGNLMANTVSPAA